MTTHPFTDPDDAVEDLAEGGTRLLDLISAVDHLRRGHRPGLTVWDAIGEALAWSTDQAGSHPVGSDARTPTDELLAGAGTLAAAHLQTAVRRWTTTMAVRYNQGAYWPHPAPRRGFPSPAIER